MKMAIYGNVISNGVTDRVWDATLLKDGTSSALIMHLKLETK